MNDAERVRILRDALYALYDRRTDLTMANARDAFASTAPPINPGAAWPFPSPAIRAQNEALALVNQQAEDEGLWFVAQTASEAYLQEALRKLHAAVEVESMCSGRR